MLDLTVYCFNDAYELSLILNGIRHYMGSATWSTMAHIVLVLAVIFAVVKIRVAERDLMSYLQGIFLPIILYVVFFTVPCKVNLTDQYSNEVQTISSVPFGVAGPLWIASLVEKSFLDVIDTTIAPPSTPKFKEVDYFGHARLMAEVSTTNLWHDPPLVQTLRDYFENCVLPEVSSGVIPIQKIKTSADLFALFASTNQSLFTPVYSDTGSMIQPCATAYTSLTGKITSAASSKAANSPFARGSMVFGSRSGNAALAAASYDAILASLFTGQQDSMEALFKQNLLINTTRSAFGAMSPDTLATISEAESRQFTTAVTGALVYIKQLPKLRALFKLVLVALFPVMGAFFLVQASRPFIYWAGTLLWISLWLPAEAGIHAAYSATAISDLRGLTASTGGYSLANNTTIVKWATESAALAGTLMIMVPVLTGFLIRWVFPQLGTAISGVLQASRGLERAVSSAAVGGVPGTSQRVLGLKQDEFAIAAMDYGQVITDARGFANSLEKSFTGMYQGTFGQRQVSRTSEGYIQQALGGPHSLSYQVSAQDVHQAQTQESTAASQFHSTMRTASAAALLEQMRTGNSSYSLAADAVKTHQISESDNKRVQAAMSRLEGVASQYGISHETLENTVKAVMLSNDISASASASLSGGKSTGADKGVSQISEDEIVKIVGGQIRQSAQLSGSLSGSGKLSTSQTNIDTFKEGSGVERSEGATFSKGVTMDKGEATTRALNESSMARLQNALSETNSTGLKTSDLIAEARGMRAQYDVARSRSEQMSSAASFGGNLTVDISNVYGGIRASGFSELRDSSPELRQIINSGANDTQVRKEGAAAFVRAYQKAEKSTNPEDWIPVLSQVQGVYLAGRKSGDIDTMRKAEQLDAIVRGQYARNFGSQASLPAWGGNGWSDWMSAPLGTNGASSPVIREAVEGISPPPLAPEQVAAPKMPNLPDSPYAKGSYEEGGYKFLTDSLGFSPSQAQARYEQLTEPSARGNELPTVNFETPNAPNTMDELQQTAGEKMREQYTGKSGEIQGEKKLNQGNIFVEHADTWINPVIGKDKKK